MGESRAAQRQGPGFWSALLPLRNIILNAPAHSLAGLGGGSAGTQGWRAPFVVARRVTHTPVSVTRLAQGLERFPVQEPGPAFAK